MHRTAQQQIHQWDMPFRVPMSVWPLRLVFPFYLLHAMNPYQGIDFLNQHFLSAYLDAATLFKVLVLL